MNEIELKQGDIVIIDNVCKITKNTYGWNPTMDKFLGTAQEVQKVYSDYIKIGKWTISKLDIKKTDNSIFDIDIPAGDKKETFDPKDLDLE